MIGLPAGTRIWLAAGVTDMRSGMNGLAARVESALTENPYSGHVFVFRGRRGDMIKVLWWTGDGLCLLAKRLEKGRFVWLRIPTKLDTCSAANWTPVPAQTGHPVQAKLDTLGVALRG